MPVSKSEVKGDSDRGRVREFLADNKGKAFTAREVHDETGVHISSYTAMYDGMLWPYTIESEAKGGTKYYYAEYDPLSILAIVVIYMLGVWGILSGLSVCVQIASMVL